MAGSDSYMAAEYPLAGKYVKLPFRHEFNQSHAFGTVVVKLASRCNLACTYCYVYEMADQSWHRQPRFISIEVVEALAERLAEYVRQRSLSSLAVVAHGGEPLLIGVTRLRHFFVTVNDALRSAGCDAHLGIQTNGTLIDAEVVKVFKSTILALVSAWMGRRR
jgi:uncharacterized protein